MWNLDLQPGIKPVPLHWEDEVFKLIDQQKSPLSDQFLILYVYRSPLHPWPVASMQINLVYVNTQDHFCLFWPI